MHWDVNKNPPPAFQADDGVPHNEALYKTFNPLIQRGKECRETKNPQAFSRLRILRNDRLLELRADDLSERASAAPEDNRHALIGEYWLCGVNELSIMLTLLLQRIVA